MAKPKRNAYWVTPSSRDSVLRRGFIGLFLDFLDLLGRKSRQNTKSRASFLDFPEETPNIISILCVMQKT